MIYNATPTTTALGGSWAIALDRLAAVLALHTARLPAIAALLAVAYYRLRQTILRLDRLARRWQANTLPAPRPGRAGQTRRRPAHDPARPRLPSGHAWLIRLVQPTAQFAGQVQALLTHPDTVALAAAAPQAGRLLRPLCRALGIAPPDWLRLPPRPPHPSPAHPSPAHPGPAHPGPAHPGPPLPSPPLPSPAPAQPRAPRPATGLLPTDRPLPAYVRAAVRAWKKHPA
ncbi:MAG: hypothetical protein IT555_17970 [Acetobacteraceae bacterium]|nr:hypothetical protein [Acetobacteraceae bacterium]